MNLFSPPVSILSALNEYIQNRIISQVIQKHITLQSFNSRKKDIVKRANKLIRHYSVSYYQSNISQKECNPSNAPLIQSLKPEAPRTSAHLQWRALVQRLGSRLLRHDRCLLIEVVRAVEPFLATSGAVAFDLVDQLPALLGGDGAAQQGGVAVEVLDDLLEWGVTGLDVEPPDDEKLKGQPDVVHDVVLPLQFAEGDGVDIAVKEEREIDCEPHDGHTLERR